MSEPSDPRVLDDQVVLFRRVSVDGYDSRTGRAKARAFRLRLRLAETALSLYDGSLVSAELILEGAPDPNWGVVAISAGDLRSIGFTVERAPVEDGTKLGEAHIEATPLETEKGQILIEVQTRLAASITWAIRPEI